tara:strand:+ start:8000 stop:8299 length:300 start_codon:yes stop_codon:yes gene_type:complete
MQREKVFADGFVFKRRADAPDFVIGNIAIKVDDAIAFLKAKAKSDGWVNLNINISKGGKPYMELDTFEPDSSKRRSEPKAKRPVLSEPVSDDDTDDLPF